MYNRSLKLVMFRYTIALQEFGMVQGQGAKKGPRSELELVGAAVLGTAMAMVQPKRKTHLWETEYSMFTLFCTVHWFRP